ncbi:hypothetical protein JVU11DRAFT_5272 [Chiua virens]|nr:hypothetical protein JVU11DRAFT_5272 [Chiua virens]
MPKKKKTQLKPLARGFATTSIPKKAVQAEEIELSADETPPTEDEVANPASADLPTAPQGAQPDSDKPGVQPDDQQNFQGMVDKYQEKTEKEISRTIKATEVDRRVSKGFNAVDVDPVLVEEILRLHLQEESSTARNCIEQTKEKAVTRLALTYGILRRLGFAEDLVEQCLRTMSGVELDEALDWLTVHCPDNEVEMTDAPDSARSNNVPDPRVPVVSKEVPPKPLEPDSYKSTKPGTNLSQTLDSGNQTPSQEGPSTSVTLPSSGSISPELDDPNLEYARLKLQILDVKTSITSQQQKLDATGVLEEKLRRIKAHYFFDERDAERLYRSELEKTNAQRLRDTLRGSLKPGRPKSPKRIDVPKTVTILPGPELQSDLFDEEDNESSGGLLEILEAPSEVEGPRGTKIFVKDMSFTKQSGGKLPQTVLLDYVSKIDRYAAVTFNSLSQHSRAKRFAVRVSWSGRKQDEWKMEDVACREDSQAEQYIATVALHVLSFPPTDGFAAGTMTSPVGNTFFRLFPSVFRDLWDELEADRKLKQERINRDIWAKLWDIVGQKIDIGRETREVVTGSVPEVKGVSQTSTHLRNIEANYDQLIADLKSRQSKSAYQEMLVSLVSFISPKHDYKDTSGPSKLITDSKVLRRHSFNIGTALKFLSSAVRPDGECELGLLELATNVPISGKSTQVPAFILEDQLSRGRSCKIYCTEPRRISAVSLAQRVSRELGDPPGTVGTLSSLVGYAIRLESNTTKNTRLTYITTGIALRMLERGSGRGEQGTAFDEITHLIIDEVHERTIESDFLLVVLKSLLPLRPDLRVILMSATVDSEKISSYFGGCSVIHVPGRTFPVDVMYLEDAVELYRLVNIEDSPYAKRLHSKFYQRKNRTDWDEATLIDEDEDATLAEGEI